MILFMGDLSGWQKRSDSIFKTLCTRIFGENCTIAVILLSSTHDLVHLEKSKPFFHDNI